MRIILFILGMSVVLTILGVGSGCSPAQRDWRANTSLDTGVQVTGDTKYDVSVYLGASYWLDYGVSVTGGMWRILGQSGPYVGANYSMVPFN